MFKDWFWFLKMLYYIIILVYVFLGDNIRLFVFWKVFGGYVIYV